MEYERVTCAIIAEQKPPSLPRLALEECQKAVYTSDISLQTSARRQIARIPTSKLLEHKSFNGTWLEKHQYAHV